MLICSLRCMMINSKADIYILVESVPHPQIAASHLQVNVMLASRCVAA